MGSAETSAGGEPSQALSIALSPQGYLHVQVPEGSDLAQIARHFQRGDGHGVFRLGATEPETILPGVLSFWRDVGRAFVVRLCGTEDLEALRASIEIDVPLAELAELAATAPPMTGGEYLTPTVLADLCARMAAAVRDELSTWDGTVEAFLRQASPAWNLVGRVCFHLAENKNDPDAPFAFLATYTTRLSARAKAQHLPLAQALREYAGARNKTALLALLEPVQRAARTSAVAKDLVDGGAVFETLAWTPAEAHRFLTDVPLMESAGLVVRMPAAWRAKRPPRPEVQVTVGKAPGKGIGADAVLDFSVAVTLDGEALTQRELRAILAGTDGLALVRGRWVQVDHERLRQVLDRWSSFEEAHAAGGLSVVEGLRLLAGADVGEGGAEALDGDVAEWSKVVAGESLARALAGLRSPETLADLDPGSSLRAELRPYQQVGLRWLWWLRSLGLGGCLADDMGLGKTIQVIALLVLLKKKGGAGNEQPSLLVVPASLIANWRAEIARFAPSLTVFIAHPSEVSPADLDSLSPEVLSAHDVVITTYGTLQRVAGLTSRSWNVVVLDEAQAIKNPGAKQTRAVKALRAQLRLALTGTPVENRLGDLWSLFDFTCPGLLGSAKAFGRLVRSAEKRSHGGYGPLRELVRPYILRRLKSDKRVVADLPDKTEVRAFCGLTKKQVALYQQTVEELRAALGSSDGIKRRGVVLASLMRLKQICNHPSQWLGDGSYTPAESGKFARLAEIADEIAARQEKALIFTQFREMTGPLADFLAGVFERPGLVLSGETEVKKRMGLVEQFQREDGPPFFVLSLKAGGTGLNLTAARHVIHFDRWWNPAVESQATDRAFRIGQRNGVLVHKFVCRGTIEEKIDALLESKLDLSRQILEGTDEVKLTELDNEQLLRLVAIDIRTALAES
ncbi:MAG TPA: DEAD/DEAH box helicase [Polyangia bacterium]|nr:DEAD/DEAH box helicase [Polyangia bacterium]